MGNGFFMAQPPFFCIFTIILKQRRLIQAAALSSIGVASNRGFRVKNPLLFPSAGFFLWLNQDLHPISCSCSSLAILL